MTYAFPFLRLVAQGTLFTSETFAFSMSLIGDGVSPPPEGPTEVPAAIVTAFRTFWGTNGVIGNQAALRTLKLNHIGTDGRYTSDSTVEFDFATPYPVGPSLGAYPAQVSLAVSLRTDAARGRAHAGRFYLPAPSAGLQSTTGTISTSSQTVVGGAVKVLLEAINTALPEWRVGVTSKVGAGAQRPVTTVAVGAALDTIRSRRADVPESYYTVAIAP